MLQYDLGKGAKENWLVAETAFEPTIRESAKPSSAPATVTWASAPPLRSATWARPGT